MIKKRHTQTFNFPTRDDVEFLCAFLYLIKKNLTLGDHNSWSFDKTNSLALRLHIREFVNDNMEKTENIEYEEYEKEFMKRVDAKMQCE